MAHDSNPSPESASRKPRLETANRIDEIADEFEAALVRRGVPDATAVSTADYLRSRFKVSISRNRSEEQAEESDSVA